MSGTSGIWRIRRMIRGFRGRGDAGTRGRGDAGRGKMGRGGLGSYLG